MIITAEAIKTRRGPVKISRGPGAQPNSAAEADIKKLLTGFVEAQRSFDLATIDASLAPDYIEIRRSAKLRSQ